MRETDLPIASSYVLLSKYMKLTQWIWLSSLLPLLLYLALYLHLYLYLPLPPLFLPPSFKALFLKPGAYWIRLKASSDMSHPTKHTLR